MIRGSSRSGSFRLHIVLANFSMVKCEQTNFLQRELNATWPVTHKHLVWRTGLSKNRATWEQQSFTVTVIKPTPIDGSKRLMSTTCDTASGPTWRGAVSPRSRGINSSHQVLIASRWPNACQHYSTPWLSERHSQLMHQERQNIHRLFPVRHLPVVTTPMTAAIRGTSTASSRACFSVGL